MKRDEVVYILKLLAFTVGVFLLTFPIWWPIFLRNLKTVTEYWK
jgi:hypothetical protein